MAKGVVSLVWRAAATALAAEEAPRPGAQPEELIEIVTGRDAVARKFRHLHETARDEVLVLVEPPFAIEASVPNLSQEEGMRRGTRVRGIYGPNAFDDPGMLGHIRRAVAAGEEARLGEVPVKLTIADRRTALLPLITEPAVAVESALVVHTSALLDALVSLFEALWQSAAPFAVGDERDPATLAGPCGPYVEDDVVALLATGLKDEAVARQLGMSARTLQRRLREEFEQLGARTRFQAGYRAGLRAAGSTPKGR